MYHFYRRCLPVSAFILALSALALSLTTLLVGIPGKHSNAPAIAIFNTSSLGLADFYDVTSVLHDNLTALTPPDSINLASITRHLGVYDWYSMHYLSNCSGFFAPSTSNPSLLSSKKINITCTRQVSGYIFTPREVVESQLKLSVKALASDLTNDTYKTSVWVSLWYSGIGNCVLALLLLPWNFKRQAHWVSSGTFWQSFISSIMLLVTSALVTSHAIHVHNSTELPGPNPYSGGFLALTWISTSCIALACILIFVDWNFGREIGEDCCSRRGVPWAARNTAPADEWKSEKTCIVAEK